MATPDQRISFVGNHQADDFLQLHDAITTVLQAEISRIQAGQGEQDLDRERIKAVFDQHGFRNEYSGLDFDAHLNEFMPRLECVHQETILDWEMLYRQYPDGYIALSPENLERADLVSGELPDDWDPAD